MIVLVSVNRAILVAFHNHLTDTIVTKLNTIIKRILRIGVKFSDNPTKNIVFVTRNLIAGYGIFRRERCNLS
jgi:hypothetical protein